MVRYDGSSASLRDSDSRAPAQNIGAGSIGAMVSASRSSNTRVWGRASYVCPGSLKISKEFVDTFLLAFIRLEIGRPGKESGGCIKAVGF